MSRFLFSCIFVHLTCADQQCEGDGCSVMVNTLLQNARHAADAVLDGCAAGYECYRLDVSANNEDKDFWGIQKLSFYDSAGDRVVTELGKASAQSYYYYYNSVSRHKLPLMAFNEVNDTSNYYKSEKGKTTGWLQYSFPASVSVASYEISASSENPEGRGEGPKFAPRAWILERMKDGESTWTQLDEQSGQNWTAGESRQFTIKECYKYNLDGRGADFRYATWALKNGCEQPDCDCEQLCQEQSECTAVGNVCTSTQYNGSAERCYCRVYTESDWEGDSKEEVECATQAFAMLDVASAKTSDYKA